MAMRHGVPSTSVRPPRTPLGKVTSWSASAAATTRSRPSRSPRTTSFSPSWSFRRHQSGASEIPRSTSRSRRCVRCAATAPGHLSRPLRAREQAAARRQGRHGAARRRTSCNATRTATSSTRSSAPKPSRLAEYLSWNVRVMHPRLHQRCQYLIGNINDNGRLGASRSRCGEGHEVRSSSASSVIISSSRGPSARDTRECLLVRIEHLEEVGRQCPSREIGRVEQLRARRPQARESRRRSASRARRSSRRRTTSTIS
jgi:DNA-directed RNA polymerase specialized sigma54-like protein